LRDKHIKWITNAKVDKIEPGMMFVTEVDDEGKDKKKHELPFKHSMMLPAFTGVDAVRHAGVEGLVNPADLCWWMSISVIKPLKISIPSAFVLLFRRLKQRHYPLAPQKPAI